MPTPPSVASPSRADQAFLDALLAALPSETSWRPYPWQVPPDEIAEHGLWLINGGRGIGKSEGCAHYLLDHVAGPPCDPRVPGGHRVGIIAPTLGDAVESCVNGPSGLRAYDPGVRLVQSAGGTYVRWPSGAEGKLFGAYGPEDVERLRAGGGRCLYWAEEIAAWRHLADCWQHARYGLRLGQRPHFVGSSTPKPRPEYKALLAAAGTITSFGRTSDATHLAEAVRRKLIEDYGGTRLGRQELEGELLEDVEGALWTLAGIEAARVTELPDLDRVVVAVDPAVTSAEGSDETGIVVAGIAGQGSTAQFYVIEDASLRASPQVWATRAVGAYERHQAERIVGEVNNGGDLIETVLRQVAPHVPYSKVSASRGKRVRAEPVAALYEQGRVHHLGIFAALEDQLISWTLADAKSPDRLDALVWAITTLTAGTGGRMRFYG